MNKVYFHTFINPIITLKQINVKLQYCFSIKHLPFKQRVGGSIPPGLTKQNKIPAFILEMHGIFKISIRNIFKYHIYNATIIM